MHKIFLIISVLFFLGIQVNYSQTIKKMDDATWTAINNVVITEFNQHSLKGISVAVVYGGNVAYANAMGNKNDDGDPFTINTKSLLASISKTITGVLTMRLWQNGDITNLNNVISQYLPAEYDGNGTTIRHLLAHQSGIAHYDNCDGGYNGPFDAGDSFDAVMDCDICMTPPGSGTLYSTFASTLLGVIINKIAFDNYSSTYGGLYNAWIRDPGGLTTLEPAYDNLDPALAEGSDGPGYWSDLGWRLPAGGFVSDIIDLANYARGMLNNTFITQATYDLMKVNQVESGTPVWVCGDIGSNNAFGLAWGISGNINDANFRTSHNGENSHGYSSHISIYPNSNAALVILTNTVNADNAMGEIRAGIETLILCPNSRDFTNNISWTEPRVFEGNQITGQSVITSTYNESYIFDAEQWVRLLPGFHAASGKVFNAIVYDGCQGSVETD